ncbi:MAG: rod shape-determining protein MreD [Pseudomonadota bacterium]
MVDPATSRRWFYRGLFLLTCVIVIFLQMLPLGTIPNRLPAPDALFAITAAWVMRRPRQTPVLLICVVFFVADMLFLRPPGVWTAAVVLGTEVLRRQVSTRQDVTIMLEMAFFAGVFAAMVAMNTLVLLMFGVDAPDVLTSALHVVITVAFYPLSIGLCRFGLGVRRPRPGEIDVDEAIA